MAAAWVVNNQNKRGDVIYIRRGSGLAAGRCLAADPPGPAVLRPGGGRRALLASSGSILRVSGDANGWETVWELPWPALHPAQQLAEARCLRAGTRTTTSAPGLADQRAWSPDWACFFTERRSAPSSRRRAGQWRLGRERLQQPIENLLKRIAACCNGHGALPSLGFTGRPLGLWQCFAVGLSGSECARPGAFGLRQACLSRRLSCIAVDSGRWILADGAPVRRVPRARSSTA